MSDEDEDDQPWEDEFPEEAPTRLDNIKELPAEAVPTHASTRDTTGKYKTLTGYGTSSDVQSELAFGRGCAHCTKKVLMALKLAQMASGTHPAIAQAQVDKLRAWMENPQNAELIRVALEEDG
jgi:hypothetical protein